MQNVYQVFQSDPVLHGAIGYNILTGRIDICKPLWWERTASAMSDTDFKLPHAVSGKTIRAEQRKPHPKGADGGCTPESIPPDPEYLNRLNGMAQNASPMCFITSWVQKYVRMAPKSCGCFCWEPFTGYSDRAASLN